VTDECTTAVELGTISEECAPYGFTSEMIGKYHVQVRMWPFKDEATATQVARIVTKAITEIEGLTIHHRTASGDRTLWGANRAN
jgi:hypothetical protein